MATQDGLTPENIIREKPQDWTEWAAADDLGPWDPENPADMAEVYAHEQRLAAEGVVVLTPTFPELFGLPPSIYDPERPQDTYGITPPEPYIND